jgi:hypothetical protein
MDTKTKIFWFMMTLLIIVSLALTAYRYLIKKDYIIQAEVDCDPYSEACFVWNCDPESQEEGEKCTGNSEDDIWYYKIINKNASRIKKCDSTDEECEELICEEGESDCEFILCNEENKEKHASEICTDPAIYLLENPTEEENESECEEKADGCLVEEIVEEDGDDIEEPMIQTTDDMISAQEEVEVDEKTEGALPLEVK